MIQHDSYKSTGSDIIPSIPSHWNMMRFGALCTESSICNHINEELLSVYLDYGVIRFADDDSRRTNPTSKDLSKYQLVEVGDFVLNNQQAWRGSVGVSKYRGIVSPAYFIFKLSSLIDSSYANYLFRSRACIPFYLLNSKGIGSIQRNLNWNSLKQCKIPVPPIKEQIRIRQYLDSKISQIDQLIIDRERERVLLKELHEAEISKVITHGLYTAQQFKNTEIFWQPTIPCTWKVTRLKYILQKLNRERQPNDELLICSNSGEVKMRGESKLGLVANSNEIYQGVKAGDLLIHGMDTWHGAIAVSNYDGMCTPVVHVCNSSQDKKYIALYLRNMATQKIFKLISNGVRQNTSDFRSWDKLSRIPIAIPPLEEQHAIVDYIEGISIKFRTILENIELEVEHLKEYKQKLIEDCVTGQIKVD